MKDQEYDVVIVGTGVAGAIIAKTLTRAGKKVLVLEAGLEAGMALDQQGAYENYQYYLRTFYKSSTKAPNDPFPDVLDAQSVDSLDLVPTSEFQAPLDKGYLVQNGPAQFGSDNWRGPGGTTMHWLGSTPRMLPHDFLFKTRYGHGADWPLTYDELMPYYNMAEYELGISGDVDAQVGPDSTRKNYGKGYVFPMKKIPQTWADQVWMKNTEELTVEMGGKHYKLNCIPTPQGRNSEPNPHYQYQEIEYDPKSDKLVMKPWKGGYKPLGAIWDDNTGQRCEGNTACVPICPVQAKYNALKTIKTAKRENLTILTQSVASTVLLDEKRKKVVGIEYKKYRYANSTVYTKHVARGKIYVLATHAIENAKILLASGAANSSDQVGRNLMDHLVLLNWGLMPEKVYPFRGPHCTTHIPTFRDGDFRCEHAGWNAPFNNFGWGWPAGAPNTDVASAVAKGLFGKRLRKFLREVITRQVTLQFETEQAANPENRVTIDPQYLDQLGNYRPVVNYTIDEYTLKCFEAGRKVALQIFAANGIEDHTVYDPQETGYVTYKGVGYNFWGAGHMIGTHRMGLKKEESVVDRNQRSWDHENLYVVGCGSMPTTGTSNPTITMAAMTFKSAEAILNQLK